MAYHHHSLEERKAILRRKLRARKRDGRVEAAFHEVAENEPSIVGKTRAKFGAARANRQRIAIALSKARKRGARIPKP